MMHSRTRRTTSYRNSLITLVVLAVAGAIFLPQLIDFKASLSDIRAVSLPMVMAAVLATFATYAASALTYKLLALHRIAYGRTVLVQLAALFVNRLLPGGLGSVGVNFLFLRRNRHQATEAATVIAVNNSLGFAGHMALVLAAVIGFHQVLPQRAVPAHNGYVIAFASVVLAVVAIAVYFSGSLRAKLSSIYATLATYGSRRRYVLAALLSSIMLTASNVLALYLSAGSVGVHISIVNALFVFSFGVGAGTITPTPGGLGGFEAGLVAGMVAYGIPAPTALAAAVIYRLVSFWLALAIGAVSFVFCKRQAWF